MGVEIGNSTDPRFVRYREPVLLQKDGKDAGEGEDSAGKGLTHSHNLTHRRQS